MILPRQPNIQPTGTDKIDVALRKMWEEIARTIDGNLSLGTFDGGPDNIAGAWYDGTTPVGANTDFTIDHKLGRIPQGWILINIDKAAILYKGITAWTKSQIFLRCNTASTHVRLFVV